MLNYTYILSPWGAISSLRLDVPSSTFLALAEDTILAVHREWIINEKMGVGAQESSLEGPEGRRPVCVAYGLLLCFSPRTWPSGPVFPNRSWVWLLSGPEYSSISPGACISHSQKVCQPEVRGSGPCRGYNKELLQELPWTAVGQVRGAEDRTFRERLMPWM